MVLPDLEMGVSDVLMLMSRSERVCVMEGKGRIRKSQVEIKRIKLMFLTSETSRLTIFAPALLLDSAFQTIAHRLTQAWSRGAGFVESTFDSLLFPFGVLHNSLEVE